jgi:hypothetical protein
VGILAIFLLVTISFASAVDTSTEDVEKKVSPLFSIRKSRAISEKITSIIENIKTRFLGDRIFFLSFPLLKSFQQNNEQNRPITIQIKCGTSDTDPDCSYGLQHFRLKCHVHGLTESYGQDSCITSMGDLMTCNWKLCPMTWD